MDGLLKRIARLVAASAIVVACARSIPAQEALPLPQFEEQVPAVESRAGGQLTAVQSPLELVEFREMPLSEAVRLLSDQSGLKIVPSAEASKTVVSLYLKDVLPTVALDAMTRANGLFYRQDRDSGIIRIYTTEEYEANLSSFREEKTEVFTLLYPNPVDVAIAIQSLFGTRVQMNIGSLTTGDLLTSQDLQQRFSRYSLVNAFNQLGTTGGGNSQTGFNTGIGGVGGVGGVGIGGGLGGIGGGLGGIGGGLGGIGGGLGGIGGGLGGLGTGFGFGNQLGTGSGQGQIEQQQLLNQQLNDLSAEQIQRLEQARENASGAGRAAIDELLQSRNARIYVTVMRRNNQIVVRTSDEQIMERIRELIQNLDCPTPLVLLEVKVMSLQLGDRFTSVFDYQFSDAVTLAGGFTAGNILPPLSDQLSGFARRNAQPLGVALPAPSPDGSNRDLTFQYVNESFRARVQLLENNNRVTNLATPLLLTANNEVSHIFIGQQIPIVIGFTQSANVANNANVVAVQPAPQTQLTQVGQGLLITPNINADRTVTLRISQQRSNVTVGGATVPVIDAAGAVNQLPIDVLDTAVVTGTVVAKDGLAVAIGGLIQENLTDTRTEVPIIGKIPVIGFFFRKQQTNRVRTELVVMIRPYVFNTPSESAMLTSDLMQELSLHPNSPDAVGTLNSFVPPEVLRANPPDSFLQKTFRFHHLVPKLY